MIGKIALILSIIALVISGYLMVNNKKTEPIDVPIAKDSTDILPQIKEIKICFINNDSLYGKSQYILDKQDELLRAQRRAQRKVENKLKKAEAEVAQMYEEMASYTTQQQQADAQARYQKLQTDLQNLQEREAEKLSNLQIESNNQLITKLDGYFDEFCDENGIDFLFTKGPGLSLLHGKEAADVTQEFIDEINAKYKIEQDSIQKK